MWLTSRVKTAYRAKWTAERKWRKVSVIRVLRQWLLKRQDQSRASPDSATLWTEANRNPSREPRRSHGHGVHLLHVDQRQLRWPPGNRLEELRQPDKESRGVGTESGGAAAERQMAGRWEAMHFGWKHFEWRCFRQKRFGWKCFERKHFGWKYFGWKHCVGKHFG